VNAVMSRQFPTVTDETPLATLQEMLLETGSVVVISKDRIAVQVITKIDLVEWIAEHQAKKGGGVAAA
jgi:predicted transcriptional regulator